MVRLPDCRAFGPGKAFTAERGPQAAADCHYGNGKDARAVANPWGGGRVCWSREPGGKEGGRHAGFLLSGSGALRGLAGVPFFLVIAT